MGYFAEEKDIVCNTGAYFFAVIVLLFPNIEVPTGKNGDYEESKDSGRGTDVSKFPVLWHGICGGGNKYVWGTSDAFLSTASLKYSDA